MFEMYRLSYSLGGQQLWFSKPEELFSRYPCFVTFNNQYLVVYAMYQFKSKYNKISLVCHNGSEEGKKLSIELRFALVNIPGWILEAADKVSWLLRKKEANIIENYDSIVDALDIDIVDNPNDTIQMNPDFDKKDKLSYQYLRIYNDTINNKIYTSKETLFGTLPCKYEDQTNCDRICKLSGGKKINKKSIRKNKKNIIKKRKHKSKKIYRK